MTRDVTKDNTATDEYDSTMKKDEVELVIQMVQLK